jgi:hypothetical protein
LNSFASLTKTGIACLQVTGIVGGAEGSPDEKLLTGIFKHSDYVWFVSDEGTNYFTSVAERTLKATELAISGSLCLYDSENTCTKEVLDLDTSETYVFAAVNTDYTQVNQVVRLAGKTCTSESDDTTNDDSSTSKLYSKACPTSDAECQAACEEISYTSGYSWVSSYSSGTLSGTCVFCLSSSNEKYYISEDCVEASTEQTTGSDAEETADSGAQETTDSGAEETTDSDAEETTSTASPITSTPSPTSDAQSIKAYASLLTTLGISLMLAY